MDSKEKNIAKYKLALCLLKIIGENKESGDSSLVTSLRKLAASSGVEYAIVQKISSGKKDPQYTTLLALSEGLGIPLHQFLLGIEEISDDDIATYLAETRNLIKNIKPKK